jgi:methylated-DNA-[protein]-cysteine S-methyltransferase
MSRNTPDLDSNPAGLRTAEVSTPLGVFRLGYVGKSVIYNDLMERGIERFGLPPEGPIEHGPFAPGSPPRQLTEYFQGRRKDFDLDFHLLRGTEFNLKVWAELSRIPYGSSRTYGEVAKRIHRPLAARAVGGAAHRNPIPIMIPCHRLVGKGGDLTGFGLGMWRKKWLLEHEGLKL